MEAVALLVGAWLNLFDGETLFGWNPIGATQWEVAGGNIAVRENSGGWLATTSRFADFELTARVKVAAGSEAAVLFRAGYEGSPVENGSSMIILTQPEKTEPKWREVKVTANGDSVTATVDGEPAKALGGGRKAGYIGLASFKTVRAAGKSKGAVEATDIKLRPLNMKSLFNGKDLTGWNIIPGHKSEFKVLDGAINIKNGNGQIETAGTYKDFILQLDIISNGDKLNSGVFFRGPVGEWWRGYESQVSNQWIGDDRTKPVDYGTGAIYGNQMARKVVSNDREWFTKTIVADENHAAVWINGYLVSDYTDMRPISKEANGKEGYVPGPGTIHLQGHDPTTDLSFKNIIIQEYPAK